MGLTHNWQRGTELAADAFARAVEDCRKVVAATGVPVAGFNGSGQPIFDRDKIIFNGAKGAGCEPFEIHQTEFDRRGRKVFWSFCKTEYAPYDVAVKAALIALKHHLGDDIKITSDAKDTDWDDARKICQQTLGYGGDFKLDPPEVV
jgi:hypothetical protein